MTREILKIIAMIAMFIDHYAMVGLAGDNWILFGGIGRLAFPIFAFQVATGYIHTKDTKKYLLTMLGFAILSEIPYNLLRGSIIYPFSQNVMFTFVLGILFIKAIDKFCNFNQIQVDNIDENSSSDFIKKIATGGIILVVANMTGFITFVDYFGVGVTMVIFFYLILSIDLPIENPKYVQVVLIGIIIAVLSDTLGGMYVVIAGVEIGVQMFATLAIIPIGIYLLTGEKKSLLGDNDRYFKYFGYLFYPLHMLLLYFIAQ